MSAPIPEKRGYVRGLQVRHADGPGAYWVTSRTQDGEHLVRITEQQLPLGACDCTDFRVRIKARLDRNEMPHKLQCIHCAAAWKFVYGLLHHTHSNPDSEP
jgi:hypothetical protein